MFDRRKNRKNKGWGDRLRAFGASLWERIAQVGPYVILAAVAAGIVYGMVYGYQRVMESPYFEVSSVEIKGVEWADKSALRHRSGLLRGVHIFDVDVDGARRALEANPWVIDATVDRDFPDRVTVDIRERHPAAVVVADGYTIVDDTGAPITTTERLGRFEALLERPLVTGLKAAELEEAHGRRLVRRGLEAARHYREQGWGEGKHRLSELHLDPVLGLTLVTTAGTEIRLGTSHWKQRMARLPTVRDALAGREIDPSYILLDHRIDGRGGVKRVTIGRR